MYRLKLLLSLFVGIVMLNGEILAQRRYEKGFVVLNSGDTLQGKVRDGASFFGTALNTRLKYKQGWWFAKKYYARELLGYQVGQEKYETIWYSTPPTLFSSTLIVIPGTGQAEFFRVLEKGALTLYTLNQRSADTDYFDYIPYLKKENSREMVRATQGIFGLKKKLLAEYFEDCPKLSEAITEKKLDSVFDVIEYYNKYCQPGKYFNPDY